MANTKISQLPSYTGSAADLRWFVMNNSGETITFKYSGYSSPYRYTNSTFSSNNTYDTNPLAGSYNHIIGGLNHSIQGNYNGVMAGYGHTFANIYSTNIFVGGGLSHTFEGGDRTASIGGNGNYFYGGEQNYGVGGQSNQIFIANNSGIIGGENCSVYTAFGTKHNGVYSGAYNKIITDAKDYNTIINGSGNTISGSSYYSTIINGSGNTIGSSYSGVSMLSCFGRTADYNDTTYLESIKLFGTFKNDVYTGASSDLRWFLMTDSGQTTTYKFSGYTSPFIVDAGNSIFSTYGTPAVYNPTQCVGSVVIGSEAVAYDDYSTVIGWKAIGNNDIEGRCVALGADAQAQGRFSTALGMSTRVSASNATAVGHNATASADGAIALGHTSTASGQYSIAIGKGNTAGGGQSFSIGYNNTDTSNNRIAIFGAGNNIGSAWSVGIGYSNTLVGANFSTESIVIGYGNTINGTGVNTGNINIGQSQIISDGSYNTLLNGKSNALQGGNYNTILNGSGNTISSSYSGVSMFSCFGRTATQSTTTHVENLHIYRTPSTNVQSVVSGTTFTCNLELGAKSQFYITGTSTINITNVRDGASFMVKTQTDGNYVMTWTATGGYTFKFDDGGQNPGNNTIDIWAFEVFGNVIYGSRRHNFV